MFEMELAHIYEHQRRIEQDMKEIRQCRGPRWTLRNLVAAFWAPCPGDASISSF